jgi:hypothetical protein
VAVQQTSSDGRPDDWQGLATAGGATGEVAPPAGGQASGFAAWRPRLAWGGALLLAAVGLFVLYLRQSLIVPLNSDGAANMLQAQSMLHGNVLLTGWWASDVTFYTTELPEYALVEVFRGLRPDVVHISGALTYLLIVLLGAMLARGRAKGRDGIIRALLAGGIMLAPSLVGGTNVLLQNPNHVGTAVPILVLLLILDRAAERWYVPAAVCVLLAWTQVADQLTLVAATAPVAAVALVRLFVLALRRRPLREYRYDALLLAAAGLSVELAKGAEALLRNFGGIFTHPLPQQLIAPSAMIPSNTRVMGQTILLLPPDRAGPGRCRASGGDSDVLRQADGARVADSRGGHRGYRRGGHRWHRAARAVSRSRGGHPAAVRRGAGRPDAAWPPA